MRTFLIIAAVLLAIAGTAQAQVAAPRLNPVAIESSIISPNRLNKPFNAAVLPWSGPSRIGAAAADLEAEDTVAGVTTMNTEADGLMVQGRFVGENFAIAVEAYSGDLTDTQTGTVQEFDASLVAVALQFGEMISVGASQQSTEFSSPLASVSENLSQFGATVRLGEVFYIGAAAGDETFELSFFGTTAEADRSVSQFGLGYHQRDGESGVHIEYFTQSADAINDPVSGITQDDAETDALTVEFIFSNILIGLEAMSSERSDSTGVLRNEVDYTTLSIGWVPEQGLSLVASLQEEEETDPLTGDKTLVDTVIVGAAWLF